MSPGQASFVAPLTTAELVSSPYAALLPPAHWEAPRVIWTPSATKSASIHRRMCPRLLNS